MSGMRVCGWPNEHRVLRIAKAAAHKRQMIEDADRASLAAAKKANRERRRERAAAASRTEEQVVCSNVGCDRAIYYGHLCAFHLYWRHTGHEPSDTDLEMATELGLL